MLKPIQQSGPINFRTFKVFATTFTLATLLVAVAGHFYKSATLLAAVPQDVPSKPIVPKETAAGLAAERTPRALPQGTAINVGNMLRWRAPLLEIIAELHQILRKTEETTAQRLGVPVAIWVDQFTPDDPDALAQAVAVLSAVDPNQARRFGLAPSGLPNSRRTLAPPTTEIATIRLNLRATNLKDTKPTANEELAFVLERAAQTSPVFDKNETLLSGQLEQVDNRAGTYTFELTLRLKHPIPL